MSVPYQSRRRIPHNSTNNKEPSRFWQRLITQCGYAISVLLILYIISQVNTSLYRNIAIPVKTAIGHNINFQSVYESIVKLIPSFNDTNDKVNDTLTEIPNIEDAEEAVVL